LGETIHGGCSELIVAKARWLTRLDTGLAIDGPSAALVAGPALAAYGLFARAGVSAGELMVVLGEGPTAGLLGALGRSRGVTVATAHGAAAAQSVQGELSSVDAGGRPQKIFVCDGDESLSAAIDLANPGSVIVFAQSTGSFELGAMAARDLTILDFSFGHPDLMTETAALVAKGELDLGPFAQHHRISSEAPDQSAAAFAQGKCLILSHGDLS
jgi:threonine dehydrogenase-like Zn-dependent dehydrogenase